MALSKKTWTVIGGSATALALTPLALATGPGSFGGPLSESGVVVAADRVAGPASKQATSPTETGPTIRAGGPVAEDTAPTAAPTQDQSSATTASSPGSPRTAATASSPASPRSAATASSPASPRTADSPASAASPASPSSAE